MNVPPEILWEQFTYLAPDDLENLSLVNVEYNSIVSNPLFQQYYSLVNNVHHGHITYVSPDGLICQGEWILGRKEGIHRCVNSDHVLIKQTSYYHDRKHGREYEFYPDGGKRSEKTYSNGLKNGKEKKWYPNGHRQLTSNYANGIKTGIEIHYDEDDNISTIIKYANGTEVDQTIYRHPVHRQRRRFTPY